MLTKHQFVKKDLVVQFMVAIYEECKYRRSKPDFIKLDVESKQTNIGGVERTVVQTVVKSVDQSLLKEVYGTFIQELCVGIDDSDTISKEQAKALKQQELARFFGLSKDNIDLTWFEPDEASGQIQFVEWIVQCIIPLIETSEATLKKWPNDNHPTSDDNPLIATPDYSMDTNESYPTSDDNPLIPIPDYSMDTNESFAILADTIGCTLCNFGLILNGFRCRKSAVRDGLFIAGGMRVDGGFEEYGFILEQNCKLF